MTWLWIGLGFVALAVGGVLLEHYLKDPNIPPGMRED